MGISRASCDVVNLHSGVFELCVMDATGPTPTTWRIDSKFRRVGPAHNLVDTVAVLRDDTIRHLHGGFCLVIKSTRRPGSASGVVLRFLLADIHSGNASVCGIDSVDCAQW